MGIMSWAGLWFGLSIPVIVLLYLFKRKYIDTTVPSHYLWNRVLRNIEANRPWQKLQNRLLLWLQLLVAALLVFALMQPYLWMQGGSKHTIIVVDASASMDSNWNEDRAAEISRLDYAKEQMRAYVDKLSRGSEVTLLKVGSQPEVLLSRELDREKWNQAIKGITPDFGQSAYGETLSLAAALTKDIAGSSVVVYSDELWNEPSKDIKFDVPVQVVSTYPEDGVNAAIEQFGVKRGTNDQVSGVAVSRNYGNTALEVVLDLYGDHQLLSSKQINIPAGEQATVTFEGLGTAEVYRLSAALPAGLKDDYAPDDMAFAFLEQGGTTNILLLTSGNLFLEKALQLTGAQVTRMDTRDSSSEKESGKPSDENLDNVPTVPKNKPDIIVVDGVLPDYFAQGEWAALLQKTPLWTLGGSGKEIQLATGDIQTAVHPVTRYLSLKESPVATLIDVELPPWASAIMNIDGKPAMYAGTEHGSARLHFLFQLSAGDLPLRPEFPILVNNAVEWLKSGKETALGRMNAGSQIEIPVDAEAVDGSWIPMDGYALDLGASKIPAASSEGRIASKQNAPAIPGLWRFEFNNSQGEVLSSYYLEVSVNRYESAINSERSLHIVENGDTAGENQSGTPYSLIYWIGWLVFIVILAEWGVYQRGRSI